MQRLYLKTLICMVLLAMVCSVQVRSETDAEVANYSGKTIEFIVPYVAGGGTYAWAESVLPYFAKYLPGNPKVVIASKPGGNGSKAANEYSEKAPLDGSSVLVTAASNQLSFLLGDSRVRYDFSQWRPLLAYRSGVVVYTSDEMGVKNIQEFLAMPDRHLVMASMGPTSDDLFVLMAFDLLNINVSSIFGSPGRGSARKIFMRGEANMDFQTTASYMANVKPDENRGKAVPLFTLGSFDEDMNYIRDPMFPHLPNVLEVYEMVHGEPPSGEAWEAWRSLLRAGQGSLKLLVIPQETSEDVVNAYHLAVKRMINDLEFQAAVVKRLGKRAMLGGQEAEKLMQDRSIISDKHRNWIINWIYDRYGVRL